MRWLLLWVIALPVLGEFRTIAVRFEGIGCASCVESLPGRMKRMRGVETAEVDAGKGVLKLTLGENNRVKVEQVRDAIEQDGTKARSAVVEVRGQMEKEDGRWVLRVGPGAAYEVRGEGLAVGRAVVSGEAMQLRPGEGMIVIEARQVRAE